MKQKQLNSLRISCFVLSWAILSFLLSIVPLPEKAMYFRPAWLGILIIYLSIALPNFSWLGFAWTLGVILDVLYGSILGLNSLGLILIAYICHQFHKQLRTQTLLHQAVWVFLLIFLYQVLRIFIKALIGEPFNAYLFALPAITSMLIWPFYASLLLRMERWTFN